MRHQCHVLSCRIINEVQNVFEDATLGVSLGEKPGMHDGGHCHMKLVCHTSKVRLGMRFYLTGPPCVDIQTEAIPETERLHVRGKQDMGPRQSIQCKSPGSHCSCNVPDGFRRKICPSEPHVHMHLGLLQLCSHQVRAQKGPLSVTVHSKK